VFQLIKKVHSRIEKDTALNKLLKQDVPDHASSVMYMFPDIDAIKEFCTTVANQEAPSKKLHKVTHLSASNMKETLMKEGQEKALVSPLEISQINNALSHIESNDCKCNLACSLFICVSMKQENEEDINFGLEFLVKFV